jgi:hypothetical protein
MDEQGHETVQTTEAASTYHDAASVYVNNIWLKHLK